MSTDERRNLPRTKSKVKRTILASITDDAYGKMANHLYIVDISKDGVRINLDRVVEPESQIALSFPLHSMGFGLQGDFRADCRVVWTKPLAGGTCILGLEFQETDEESQELLQLIIDHWAQKEGLELETLPTPVDTKLRFQEGEPWSRMVGARALSLQGFRFPSRQLLESEQDIEARLLLETGTVEAKAKVRWCKPMPNGAHDIGCEFLELTSSDQSFITLHLRRCRHRPM